MRGDGLTGGRGWRARRTPKGAARFEDRSGTCGCRPVAQSRRVTSPSRPPPAPTSSPDATTFTIASEAFGAMVKVPPSGEKVVGSAGAGVEQVPRGAWVGAVRRRLDALHYLVGEHAEGGAGARQQGAQPVGEGPVEPVCVG